MKRSDLRTKFKESGLRYSMISYIELFKLETLLKDELSAFKNESEYNTFTMQLVRTTIKDGTRDLIGYVGAKKYVFFHIKGIVTPIGGAKPFVHFKKRECISFNRDGFIGFAGEMDSKNVQPILRAFDRWIDILIDKL